MGGTEGALSGTIEDGGGCSDGVGELGDGTPSPTSQICSQKDSGGDTEGKVDFKILKSNREEGSKLLGVEEVWKGKTEGKNLNGVTH